MLDHSSYQPDMTAMHTLDTAPDTVDDTWTLGTRTFRSRIIVGTGKYASLDETRDALAASGAEMVTVALRRIDLQAKGPSLLEVIARGRPHRVTAPARHALGRLYLIGIRSRLGALSATATFASWSRPRSPACPRARCWSSSAPASSAGIASIRGFCAAADPAAAAAALYAAVADAS